MPFCPSTVTEQQQRRHGHDQVHVVTGGAHPMAAAVREIPNEVQDHHHQPRPAAAAPLAPAAQPPANAAVTNSSSNSRRRRRWWSHWLDSFCDYTSVSGFRFLHSRNPGFFRSAIPKKKTFFTSFKLLFELEKMMFKVFS